MLGTAPILRCRPPSEHTGQNVDGDIRGPTRTHSTTPIQNAGGFASSPSGLALSHLAIVQWVFGFHTWKNGKYGLATSGAKRSASSVCTSSFVEGVGSVAVTG